MLSLVVECWSLALNIILRTTFFSLPCVLAKLTFTELIPSAANCCRSASTSTYSFTSGGISDTAGSLFFIHCFSSAGYRTTLELPLKLHNNWYSYSFQSEVVIPSRG